MIANYLRSVSVRLLRVVASLAAMLFLLSSVVFAHADYDESVPAAGETLSKAPQQVQVWFTQEMFRREGQNSLEVYGPDEQRVDLDDAAIDDDNRKLMTVSLQSDLADGVYTVHWRTLSADDGDDADGEFQFTIQAGESEAAETPTAAPSPSATATSENGQPTPTPTALAPDPSSESADPPPEQADQGPAIPCLGGSAPALFFVGALLLARRRTILDEFRRTGISRFLSGRFNQP